MYYQGENKEVTWGLLGGSVIENYFEDAEEEKFRSSTDVHIQTADGHQVVKLWVIANECIVNARHIAEQAVKHSEADTVPSG